MAEEKKKFNKQEYDNNYLKQKKDRLNFVMDKGTKDRINAAAKQQGVSAAEICRQAIEEKLIKLSC